MAFTRPHPRGMSPKSSTATGDKQIHLAETARHQKAKGLGGEVLHRHFPRVGTDGVRARPNRESGGVREPQRSRLARRAGCRRCRKLSVYSNAGCGVPFTVTWSGSLVRAARRMHGEQRHDRHRGERCRTGCRSQVESAWVGLIHGMGHHPSTVRCAAGRRPRNCTRPAHCSVCLRSTRLRRVAALTPSAAGSSDRV